MFGFPLIGTAAATGVPLLPVALKALGEGHRVLMSDALARQGLGPVGPSGGAERNARQRAAGVPNPGVSSDVPDYFDRVPNRPVAGDKRRDYEVGGLGDATSSKGILEDILDKVPRKTYGLGDYKRINRPYPKRPEGFDNQGATP